MFLRFGVLLVLFLGCSLSINGQSIKKLKSEADAFYKHEKYSRALAKYYSVQYRKPDDMGVRTRIGACSYYTNKPEQAKKYLHYVLENDKSPNAETYLYLAKTYQGELNFSEAIKFYKFYLRNIKDNHKDRNWVKTEIRRCASGLRLVAKDQLAIVENLGETVNGPGDDFAPMLSPNFGDKIYFSSARPGNRGGLRDEKGLRDEQFGKYKADMFSTQVVNGAWTATSPLNPVLNSARHEIILGFGDGGKLLHYFKGPTLFSGELLVDTFKVDAAGPNSGYLNSPMNGEAGDGTPFFVNDSTIIFSSFREGGFGGRDLYITKYSYTGQWSRPLNLGPVINSPYDETTPFLSQDGRTLYFSSNTTNSMGGLDVFKSTFDDFKEQWSTPENMGIPINSAADDAYFKLSRDGYKGFFSSDRIDGEGMRDIYVAYFRSPNREQLVAMTPTLFSDVREYKLQKQSGVSVAMETPKSEVGTVSTITSRNYTEDEITEYKFKPLFYNKDEQILTNTNTQELNKVARLLIQYPQLRLVVTSNSDGGTPKNFDLYFSLKRGEEVVTYLTDHGVKPGSITVKGCGINYPIAKIETESGFNAQALRLNRRIDLEILNTTGLPIRIKKEEPVVNQRIESKSDDYYRTAIQGLSYKVQVAAIKQMYNGAILTEYPDPMVEMTGEDEYYKYTVGLYQTFSSANELRKDLIRQGVTDAFIVPYVNGVRVNKDDSKIYSAAYPDLLNFLEKTE